MCVPAVRRLLIAAPDVEFLITVLAAHGISAAVVVLIEPIPNAAVPPLSVVNEPPTMTLEASGATTIDHTWPSSTLGAQPCKAPPALNAASLVRAVPLTAVKGPPA